MEYRRITASDRELFIKLMGENCLEGNDGRTDREEAEELSGYIFDKLTSGKIGGRFAVSDEAVGFVLWAAEGSVFCELEGFATILELWVKSKYRLMGIGRGLAECAEHELGNICAEAVYVCADSPAEGFWRRCGYGETDKTAMNGLQIYLKHL